jgi:hypothetical protein
MTREILSPIINKKKINNIFLFYLYFLKNYDITFKII